MHFNLKLFINVKTIKLSKGYDANNKLLLSDAFM